MIRVKGRDMVQPMAWKPLKGMANASAWRTQRPVVSLETCTGCLLCWKFCPDAAITIRDDGKVAFDLAACKGCGVCMEECPVDAIHMEVEAR